MHKHIYVSGFEALQKIRILQILREASSEEEGIDTFTIYPDCMELVTEEDYVILADEISNWSQVFALEKRLQELSGKHPAGVLYLSDDRVYGKKFGASHLLKEEEFGYACHTDGKDTSVQCLRMAEHLCSRIAREQGLNLKIARLDHRVLTKTEENLVSDEELIRQLMSVLASGEPGEAYNVGIPAGKMEIVVPVQTESEEVVREPEWKESRSPLSPMEIRLDIGKAGKL